MKLKQGTPATWIGKQVIILKNQNPEGFRPGTIATLALASGDVTREPRIYALIQDGKTEWMPEENFGGIGNNVILRSKVMDLRRKILTELSSKAFKNELGYTEILESVALVTVDVNFSDLLDLNK